jgi:hypothetical protein
VEQITKSLRLRRTILQFSQIRLTLARIFIANLLAFRATRARPTHVWGRIPLILILIDTPCKTVVRSGHDFPFNPQDK